MAITSREKQLKARKRRHEEEAEACEHELNNEKAKKPKPKYYYVERTVIGEDIEIRSGRCITKYPLTHEKRPGESIDGIDIRRWSIKRDQPLWHGQGILIPIDNWIKVYLDIRNIARNTIEPKDYCELLYNDVQETRKLFPKEFAQTFGLQRETIPIQQVAPQQITEPKYENIIRPSLQQSQVVKNQPQPSVQKNKSNEDTNWHQLKKVKGRKVDPETKDWVMKNL